MDGQFRCGRPMDGSGAGTPSSSPNRHREGRIVRLSAEGEAADHALPAEPAEPMLREHGLFEAARGALPAGHPLSWALLTAGTLLDGTAYGALP